MGNRRTYDTSEKIYPLPRPHSVAVLHAGNVLFHGMPYSTIIDGWIDSLAEHRLRYVDDYVMSFRKFLVEEMKDWCDQEQQRADFIWNMDGEFKRIWNRLSKNGVVVSAEDALLIWKSEVEYLETLDRYGQFTNQTKMKLVRKNNSLRSGCSKPMVLPGCLKESLTGLMMSQEVVKLTI